MFICADTEDDSPELLAAGKSGFDKRTTGIAALTTDGSQFYNDGNGKEFLDWFCDRPEQHCYFHNLQYDLGNLFAHNLDALDVTMVAGRMIRAKWKQKVFLDSHNIWSMRLADLGEIFGLTKLAMDVRSREYVMRDVEIMVKAMTYAWDMAAKEGIEVLPATIGGLAVKLWKAWGGSNTHDSSLISRKALYGGRVELFKQVSESRPKDNSVAYTDVNSLYPSTMLRLFPGPCESCDDMMDYGVATVDVSIPKGDVGILPYRDAEGRILYPTGKFSGTWCVPELQAMIARGGKITKYHDGIGTNDADYCYKDYMEKTYKRRLASKTKPEKEFWKRMMNHLYGRLGTTGTIGRSVIQTDKNRDEGVPYGNKVMVSYQMPLSEEVNWLHAAYVTCYGRCVLADYIDIIGVDNMIYCDTDSTIFDCPDKVTPFDCSKELGEMKLESWESWAATYAPKMYEYGDKSGQKRSKAKGVPVRLAAEFIASGRAEFDLPYKFREAITFYDRDNSKQLSVWRTVTKKNTSKYDKKILKNNRYYARHINQVGVM